MKKKHAGGRPPKFPGPRRVITMTLSERTLAQLALIDDDRARAIAKVVDAATVTDPRRVEIVKVSEGVGLIVVGPSKHLRRIPFLRLCEIAPARFLLVIPTGTAADALEVALLDLIESVPESDAEELRMLVELREKIKSLRRGDRMSKAEIICVSINDRD